MDMLQVKRLLIGKPFPTSMELHERLDKVRGLAVFASDPISSNAYATEAIMSVLIVLGSGALTMTLPIGLAVAALVLMVVFSYVQTILHYPEGGGAYIVSKDNLGRTPSLLAAGALLTDYVLTVSVSVSAGVRAVTSAFPEVHEYRVIFAIAAIVLITWVNLRGMRESGSLFAVPTYAFAFGVLVIIGIGLARTVGLFGMPVLEPHPHPVDPTSELYGFAYIWLLLRAFAGGCTALTGIEAISDGVKAFKPPESINAAKTMVVMGVIAMSLFLGITFLSTQLQLVPEEAGESILSQMTSGIVGRGFLYYWVQFFTAMILFLAANTGYQDFPRLSSFLSKDGFLPRWMSHLGERLVFSGGIITLAAISSIVVIAFQAEEIAMLPLYALGVMLSFSLSQAGMYRLMTKISQLKPGEVLHTAQTVVKFERGAKWKRFISLFGAITTSAVFIVLITTKFLDGGWIIVVAIPGLVYMFRSINKHYMFVSASLRTKDLKAEDFPKVADVVIVPVGDIHRGSLLALQYAKRLSKDVRAVCIITSDDVKERFMLRWNRFPELVEGIELVCIPYDYRDILTPLVDYIEQINLVEFPNQMTTVVIPEFVPEKRVENLLHNQTAVALRQRLLEHNDIIMIEVPYHVGVNTIIERMRADRLSDEVLDYVVGDKHAEMSDEIVVESVDEDNRAVGEGEEIQRND